jgi:hypothetical protein
MNEKEKLAQFKQILSDIAATKGMRVKWDENHTDGSLALYLQVFAKSGLSLRDLKERVFHFGPTMPTLNEFKALLGGSSPSDHVLKEKFREYAAKIRMHIEAGEYPAKPTGHADLDLAINRWGGMARFSEVYAKFGSGVHRFTDYVVETLVTLYKHPPESRLPDMTKPQLPSGEKREPSQPKANLKSKFDSLKQALHVMQHGTERK